MALGMKGSCLQSSSKSCPRVLASSLDRAALGRKAPLLARWLVTALSLGAAYFSHVPVAAAQTSPMPTDTASTSPDSPEPANPMSIPRLLVEDPRREVPQHRRPHRVLLATGAVVLIGSYTASVFVAAKSDRSADEKLFLPVVGPWLDLKRRDCGVNPCDHETVNKVLLISDGALQGFGALSLLLSLVIPEPRERPWYAVGSHKLRVVPQVGQLSGFSAVGEF